MGSKQQTYAALLRGINVSGRRTIPMAELRSLFADIGCNGVRTYIQSGNVVFTSSAPAAGLERRLENAIEQEFGFFVPVVVRSASRWARYIEGLPFLEETGPQANWVLLVLSKEPPVGNAASKLQRRATGGERVTKRGDAIWIHYAKGVARSKLTPAVLDKEIGSPATARNWRTALKIHEMLQSA